MKCTAQHLVRGRYRWQETKCQKSSGTVLDHQGQVPGMEGTGGAGYTRSSLLSLTPQALVWLRQEPPTPLLLSLCPPQPSHIPRTLAHGPSPKHKATFLSLHLCSSGSFSLELSALIPAYPNPAPLLVLCSKPPERPSPSGETSGALTCCSSLCSGRQHSALSCPLICLHHLTQRQGFFFERGTQEDVLDPS